MSIDDHGQATSKAAGATTGWLNKLHDSLHIFDILARGFRVVGAEAVEMARKIQQAVSFKEGALLGLQTSLGAKGGSKMFDDVMGMAVRFGGSPQAMVGQAQDFARFKAPPQMALLLTKAMLDVKALGGVHGQRDADEVTSAVMDALSEGKITERTMRRFKGILPLQPMLKSIMTAQGLRSPAEAHRQLQEGVVPGDRVMGMVLEGTQALQKGPIGTSALKAAGNLEGLIERLQARTLKLFSGIADTPGFKKMEGAFGNLVKVLGEGKTQGLLNDLVNKIGKMVEPLTGIKGRDNLRAFFKTFKEGLADAIEGVGVLASGFLSVLRFLKNTGEMTGQTAAAFKVLFSDEGGAAKHDAATFLLQGLGGMESFDPPNMKSLTPESRARVYATTPGRFATQDVPPLLERPQPGPPPRPNITVNATLNLRGVPLRDPDDAHDIAKKFTDQVTTSLSDALEQFQNEQGG